MFCAILFCLASTCLLSAGLGSPVDNWPSATPPINILNKDCGVSGRFYISLCHNWSATRARSASPGSRACWQIAKFFWPLPPPPTDETACTRQPCLRPGCCLHAISFSDVVLTPLATYGHYIGLYSSDQGRLHHLKGLWSWPPPRTPYRNHEPGIGSLCEHEREWMGQKMQTNGTENVNEWDREHKRMGQRIWMKGTENVNKRTVNANGKQNMTTNEREQDLHWLGIG